MSRYEHLFARLSDAGEGAFIPFAMLGDPDPEASLDALRALLAGGADALELGIPFSDPIADGPTIQAAASRALAAGGTPDRCFEILGTLRGESEAPFGLLVYANLVVGRGLDGFYRRAAEAGVDSVLVADVPTLEAAPFAAAARAHGVAPVMIAPPDVDDARLAQIAELGDGYTYVLTRAGVTGAQDDPELAHRALVERLTRAGAPPSVFGFGISRPAHVRAAIDAGAAGAISGSAVVAHFGFRPGNAPLGASLTAFVREMKAATRRRPG